MAEAMVEAVAELKPARLAVGMGKTTFAVNRREPTAKGIINGFNPSGPADHDVPVLRVVGPDGKLRAVVFGYACHNTTLNIDQYGGDYAGIAQQYLEEKRPGALALFWMGCGADANPLPRGTIALCQKYGHMLANTVDGVLAGPMISVQGRLAAAYSTIELPYGPILRPEQISADLLSKDYTIRTRAERLSKLRATTGKFDATYPSYPVQVVRLGGTVRWVALGGEVVVDYSIRLKKELGAGPPVWITAYANDVVGYIPSARVLKEGGYEGESSQYYYGHPGPWSPVVEDKIVAEVLRLAPRNAGK
jgi:hypothetical protein